MRKIGELLSSFFDENTIEEAKGYHSLFSSWPGIAGEQLAAHSRIVELEHSVLFVEADHPGWIQILQTRQKQLLVGVRRRFPALTINAIAFRLSREPPSTLPEREEPEGHFPEGHLPEPDTPPDPAAVADAAGPAEQDPLDGIGDLEFREALRRFSKTARTPRRSAKNGSGGAGRK